MRVSCRSWHFRLLKWFPMGDRMPVTSCGYIWKLIYLFTVGFPLMACVTIVILPFVAILVLVDYLQQTFFQSQVQAAQRRASLLGQWFENKKRKICPLVEYIDDEPIGGERCNEETS